MNRRSFLRGLGAGAAAATTAGTAHASAKKAERKRRWGMVIDLDRCSACGACTAACREENNVPVSCGDSEHRARQIEWISIMWQEPEEGAEDAIPSALPFPCQHCADAPCVKACPVGATMKSPDGITMQIWERCIGCRYCMVACPYGRRSFNWDEPQWEGTLAQMLNPDVATRPEGVVEKCTFCHHRLRRVREEAELDGRELTDEEVQHLPACASACAARAMTFGDLADPESSVAKQAASPRAFKLLEHLGTDPSVIYLKRDRRP